MTELLSNSAHIHVLLNHVPTVGFGLGLAVFLFALLKNNDGLKKVGLAVFFIVANIAIATYVSGNGAEATLKGRPDVALAAIRAHEDAAMFAFIAMELTGFFAWFALWQWKRLGRLPGWNVPVLLVLALTAFALMANAANLGGEIRHEEVRWASSPVPSASDPVPIGLAREVGTFVSGRTWVWPACETIHFIGLCLLFTVVLIVDLRMLGMIKSVSFAAAFQLLPIGMVGFGLNLITGMMFFLGNPGQYVHNSTFFWKIVFVLAGGFNVLYFTMDDEPWKAEAGAEAPFTAKLAAASAMFIWAAVLFCGHMLPFIGNAF